MPIPMRIFLSEPFIYLTRYSHCLRISCAFTAWSNPGPFWMLYPRREALSDWLFTTSKTTSSSMCECLNSTLQHFTGSKPTPYAQRIANRPRGCRRKRNWMLEHLTAVGLKCTLVIIISGDLWDAEERHPTPTAMSALFLQCNIPWPGNLVSDILTSEMPSLSERCFPFQSGGLLPGRHYYYCLVRLLGLESFILLSKWK